MDEVYHVYNRSLEEMEIFKDDNEYTRFMHAVQFYKKENPQIKFSDFLEQSSHRGGGMKWKRSFIDKEELVTIIAYCIMPTHFHLVLSQAESDGISVFINNLLNSYTRYFNTKYKRKGTLWEGKTKKTLVESDEQLLHLTRYVHLNPVTAYLVDKPEKWIFSSYNEYLSNNPSENSICDYKDILNIQQDRYKNFVEGGISYQREMAKVKKQSHRCGGSKICGWESEFSSPGLSFMVY
jgi:putative transposase